MMRKFLLATTAIAAVAATMSFASPIESIISQLESQGYDRIEIKEGPNQIKVEAINGETETRFEAIYDILTGLPLKEETYAVTGDDDIALGFEVEAVDRDFIELSDDDDDDDEDDDDDDDEDDDDDADEDDADEDDDEDEDDDDDDEDEDDDDDDDEDDDDS